MTRSRKKLPIVGITTAKTDKPFKQREHRRERAAARNALAARADMPHAKQFGDASDGDKDGKQYRPDLPEVRRK